MNFFRLVKKPNKDLLYRIQSIYDIDDFYATMVCFLVTISSLDQKSRYYDDLYKRMDFYEDYDSCKDIEKCLDRMIPDMRAECGQEYVRGYSAVIRKELLAYVGAYPQGYAEINCSEKSVLAVLHNEKVINFFIEICGAVVRHRAHMRSSNDYLVVCCACGDIPEKLFKKPRNRK